MLSNTRKTSSLKKYESSQCLSPLFVFYFDQTTMAQEQKFPLYCNLQIRILLQTFKVGLPVTPRYHVIISCDLVVGLGLAEF